jgi:hypothetical protein
VVVNICDSGKCSPVFLKAGLQTRGLHVGRAWGPSPWSSAPQFTGSRLAQVSWTCRIESQPPLARKQSGVSQSCVGRGWAAKDMGFSEEILKPENRK